MLYGMQISRSSSFFFSQAKFCKVSASLVRLSRALARESFGDAEGDLDPTRAIADIRLRVAVQMEPGVSAAELKSRSEADRALQRIRHAAAVDFVIGHLLQPVPTESKPQFARNVTFRKFLYEPPVRLNPTIFLPDQGMYRERRSCRPSSQAHRCR